MTPTTITSSTITMTDLAGRYKSTAGTQRYVDPALINDVIERVKRDGYVIIEKLFTDEEMDALKAYTLPRYRGIILGIMT